MATTIQVDKKIRDRLKNLKLHPRESYNEVVARLVELRTEEGGHSEETLKNIEQSLEDIKAGRTLSLANSHIKRLKSRKSSKTVK